MLLISVWCKFLSSIYYGIFMIICPLKDWRLDYFWLSSYAYFVLQPAFQFFLLFFLINLLRMAGWFIDQRRKGKERIISITTANKEVALMQMWVKSTHWLLLKRETIPTKPLINRKGDTGTFCSQKASVLKRLERFHWVK